MNFEIVDIEQLNCSGMSVQLTTSQIQNAYIISNHWRKFNRLLKVNNAKHGQDWKKYGVTKKQEGAYIYITAVPSNNNIEGLTPISISGGRYFRFSHVGEMSDIKSTISKIYRDILPANKIALNTNRDLVHFEQYDYRFHWNSLSSVIDIYVPIGFVA